MVNAKFLENGLNTKLYFDTHFRAVFWIQKHRYENFPTFVWSLLCQNRG